MRRTRRFFFLLLIMSVLLSGMAIPALAASEGTIVNKINSSRVASGLTPLETFWDLTDDARAHSVRMAERGQAHHNPALSAVTSVWMSLSENVGMGVDIGSLHSAFMSSPSHRANILGDFNYMGVGVKTDAAGVLWVTVVFMKAAPGLNNQTGATTTTQPPVTAMTQSPVTTTTTTQPPAATTTTTTQPPAATTTTTIQPPAATTITTTQPPAIVTGTQPVTTTAMQTTTTTTFPYLSRLVSITAGAEASSSNASLRNSSSSFFFFWI